MHSSYTSACPVRYQSEDRAHEVANYEKQSVLASDLEFREEMDCRVQCILSTSDENGNITEELQHSLLDIKSFMNKVTLTSSDLHPYASKGYMKIVSD